MTESTQAWDSYWVSNNSTNSFEFDYATVEGPYAIVNKFWQQVFAQFNETHTIVDLGAGNGALANLFVQSRSQTNCLKWINIDSANAQAVVKDDKITYQQDNIEKLSLVDDSVNHFISMFGAEYAQLPNAFVHIQRCLTKKGQFTFVMHHKDSIISQQSRITAYVQERILASDLLQNLHLHTTFERLQHHLLSGLNKHIRNSEPKLHDDIKIIGQTVYFILKSNINVNDCIVGLKDLIQDTQLHMARLRQQLSAADQVANIEALLVSHGLFDFSLNELKYNDDILAWVVTGHKI
jgi:ubiquinone/menaquinone biosynthesis C-methylase UbiE